MFKIYSIDWMWDFYLRKIAKWAWYRIKYRRAITSNQSLTVFLVSR